MSEKFLRSLTIGGDKMIFLPSVGTDNNEKVLKVIDGEWNIGTLGQLDSTSYVKFTANEEFTLKINNERVNWDGILEYSTDGTTYNTWDGTEINSSNNALYLRGMNNTAIGGASTTQNFVFGGSSNLKINSDGEIGSLLNWQMVAMGQDPPMGENCFRGIFRDCQTLVTAPSLRATILANNCYRNMFVNCKSLLIAPNLPATQLKESCYNGMFQNCISLTAAPIIAATELAQMCCQDMFYGCYRLQAPPALNAIISADACYRRMFSGCSILEISSNYSGNNCAWTAFENLNNATANMFQNTWLDDATFPNDGTPTMNNTYYWHIDSNFGGEENFIKFYIDGYEFTARENMTWQEWCDGPYNGEGFQTTYEDFVTSLDGMVYVKNTSGEKITGSDLIIDNYNYITS